MNSRGVVRHISSNRPGAWTPDEEALLARVWTSDKTVAEITALFPGRGEGAVIQRVKRMRKLGVPIGNRPIIYVPSSYPPQHGVQPVDAMPGVTVVAFRDDPRAREDHGSPGQISRCVTHSPMGCSASWAVRV